jgi:hypothetical protein
MEPSSGNSRRTGNDKRRQRTTGRSTRRPDESCVDPGATPTAQCQCWHTTASLLNSARRPYSRRRQRPAGPRDYGRPPRGTASSGPVRSGRPASQQRGCPFATRSSAPPARQRLPRGAASSAVSPLRRRSPLRRAVAGSPVRSAGTSVRPPAAVAASTSRRSVESVRLIRCGSSLCHASQERGRLPSAGPARLPYLTSESACRVCSAGGANGACISVARVLACRSQRVASLRASPRSGVAPLPALARCLSTPWLALVLAAVGCVRPGGSGGGRLLSRCGDVVSSALGGGAEQVAFR